MAENLVVALQERLGFSPFEKIDPNIPQDKTELRSRPGTDHYTQAAAISVLAGIYKFGSAADNAAILLNIRPDNLLTVIFGDKENDVIKSVSYYGDRNYDSTKLAMTKIAIESIEIIKKGVGDSATPEKIASYLTGQRHNILVCLPPDLQLGTIIDDNSFDDVTNKMEGPVSGLVHFFENLFAEKK